VNYLHGLIYLSVDTNDIAVKTNYLTISFSNRFSIYEPYGFCDTKYKRS